jgi:hypothetical protein
MSENISSAMLRNHFFKWIESKILNCKPDSAAVQMLQRALSESDFYFKLNVTQKQKNGTCSEIRYRISDQSVKSAGARNLIVRDDNQLHTKYRLFCQEFYNLINIPNLPNLP